MLRGIRVRDRDVDEWTQPEGSTAVSRCTHGWSHLTCPGMGFYLPKEAQGSAVLFVETGLQQLFKETCFMFLIPSRWSSFPGLECFTRLGVLLQLLYLPPRTAGQRR